MRTNQTRWNALGLAVASLLCLIGAPGVAEETEAAQAGAEWKAHLEGFAGVDEKGVDFWAPRLEILFDGIELGPEQQSQLDTKLAQLFADRDKLRDQMEQRDSAAAEGNQEGAKHYERKIEITRTSLKPINRMEQLREVLSEQQKSAYDLNRARVFAKYRKAAAQRARAGGKNPGVR